MNTRRDASALSWLGLAVIVAILGAVAFLGYFSKVESLLITIIFWIINVVFFIWAGNRFISKWLDKNLPWDVFVSRRFFIQLLSSGIYSLLVVNLTFYFFRTLFTSSAPDFSQMAVMNIYGLLFVLPAISIHFGIYFMTQWKKTKLKSEQLEKENIRTQLEVLKSHIDPHFLFNNLNILSSLIDEDKDTARKFLDNFAEVYRYVLKNKQVELVSLEEELEFLNSYVYLLKNRFGERLIFQNDIIINTENLMIPPLALQIVVENVIKHNKIDGEMPLTIEMFTEKEKLVVKNNLQKKNQTVNSSNSGLKNIKKRFEFLSDKEVDVLNIESHFIVKLPLLEVEK
ncbi:MAG: histidine kinase [Cytophagales bacterium]